MPRQPMIDAQDQFGSRFSHGSEEQRQRAENRGAPENECVGLDDR
jgi:hypothetical protein